MVALRFPGLMTSHANLTALSSWPTLARYPHFHVSDPSSAPPPNQRGLIRSFPLQVGRPPLDGRAREVETQRQVESEVSPLRRSALGA